MSQQPDNICAGTQVVALTEVDIRVGLSRDEFFLRLIFAL